MSNKIKVLIVDDSALVRKLLSEILDTAHDIEVVGTAQDPFIARDKIKKLNPDVITLDVEMPKMDGITFLRNLMRLRPMPVVMVSSLTQSGADITLQALEIGAFDFVSKPVTDVAHKLQAYKEDLIDKLRAAAGARIRPYTETASTGRLQQSLDVDEKHNADVILNKTSRSHFTTTEAIVAIGASTGGTEAIKDVLIKLPPATPGIVITQHIPGNFSAAFANRMNSICAITVTEARDGDQILPGHAFIAPGDKHLLVVRNGARYHCQLSDGPPVNRHKPAVDVLFRSTAQCAGPNSVGILLTGMGDDGAKGLKELQDVGATTIAQDEKTSVVWGMPGSAVKLGAADEVIPLGKVADRIMTLTQHERRFGT